MNMKNNKMVHKVLDQIEGSSYSTSDRSRPGPAFDSLDPMDQKRSPRLMHGQAWVPVVSGVSTIHVIKLMISSICSE